MFRDPVPIAPERNPGTQRNANINARLNRIELRLYTLVDMLHQTSERTTADSSFNNFKPLFKRAIQEARKIEFTNGNVNGAVFRKRRDWYEGVARQAASRQAVVRPAAANRAHVYPVEVSPHGMAMGRY